MEQGPQIEYPDWLPLMPTTRERLRRLVMRAIDRIWLATPAGMLAPDGPNWHIVQLPLTATAYALGFLAGACSRAFACGWDRGKDGWDQ